MIPRPAILAWAHPAGSIDQLLRAAALTDEDEARGAWRQWARENDLDRVSFHEMRLLAAVAPRLERLDPAHPARGRIVGSERMLWSRSRMILHEVRPALGMLQRSGIETMVFKGAARVAGDAAAAKFRILNDVDVLVRPELFRRAFDDLIAAGWRATGPGSPLFHRATLDAVHGLNLKRGRLADIDLHRSAYHLPHQSPGGDEPIWRRSRTASLADIPVRVPSPTDMVLIALAHGGVGGHATSDWMLDIVDAIRGGDLDWELFEEEVRRRRLETCAAVTLTYLEGRLDCPAPKATLDRIVRQAGRRPWRLLSGLLMARPKTTLSRPANVARGLVKLWQKHVQRVGRAARIPRGVHRASRLWSGSAPIASTTALRTSLAPPERDQGVPWSGVLEMTIAVAAPDVARRIEFELNSETRHLARLKHRTLTGRGRRILLRFRVPVELAAEESTLTLESIAGRELPRDASPSLSRRYEPLPFVLVDSRCRRRAA